MPTRKWGSEKLVNTSLTGGQYTSSVAALDGGGFVVVWEDRGGAAAVIRGQRYDAAGNRVGGEFNVSALFGETLDQTTPAVTALAGGGFFVSWEDTDSATDRDIVGVVFNSAGNFVRTQASNSFSADTVNVELARLGAGAVSVWGNSTTGDINLLVFDGAGVPGTAITANTDTAGLQYDPDVAAAPNGSRIAAVWTNDVDDTIRVRLFDGSGAGLAAGDLFVSSGANPASAPQVVWLNNGQFVVVWREYVSFNYEIKAKLYDGTGTTASVISGTIPVNSVSYLGQEDPQIAALPNGGFVVAWRDDSGIGGDDGIAIKLQAFDAAGGKTGGEFLVNTSTLFAQFEPSIAVLADGRVAVTWTDESTGPTDIRMQIVDPRDGIVAGTAGNDTLYGHEAVADEINGFGGNDILNGLGGADQIYGGQGDDLGVGGRGDDTLFGDSGADTLRGDLGDDELFGGDGSDLLTGAAGADLHDGGAGFDIADYFASPTGVTVALDGSLTATGYAVGDTFVAIESLRGSNAATSGDRLRGDAFSNTLYGFAGNDILEGGLGADTLLGYDGVDTLTDAGGNDYFTGGLGADSLTGGAGNDIFNYALQTEGGDTVADFSSSAAGNNDIFYFENIAFGGLPVGSLTAAQFQSSTANVAANTSVRFFYETDTRILRFDQDGAASGFAPVVIATLQVGATMVIGDIYLY